MTKIIKSVILYCLLAFMFTACNVTKKVRDGDTAYALKQYAVAIDFLEKEYMEVSSRADRGRKAYYLARSKDFLQQHDEAIAWYEKALKNEYPAMRLADMADAYKRNEQYSDALRIFEQAYRQDRKPEYLREIDICKKAISSLDGTGLYNLSAFPVNTKYAEYSPVFFGEDYLVFTSDRENSTGRDTYNWTGNAFSDLYVVDLKGRQINNFDAMLNSSANEGTACFSQDLNEIFFTRCESTETRDQYCKIYYSQKPNGFWMEPEALMFFGDDTNFAHPCLIENDSVLVFAASPNNGDGTYDLYYSERVEGGWNEPELMPTTINSSGNEKFPTAYADTLYFSSDHLTGYGGYDLFKTYLKADGRWTSPKNLGLPLNSGGDDFGLMIDTYSTKHPSIEWQGYFSSSRNMDSSDDIFFVTKSIQTKQEEEPTIVINKDDYRLYLSVRVVERQYVDEDPNGQLIGKEPLTKVELSLGPSYKRENLMTDNTGRMTKELVTGGSYKLVASKNNYLSREVLIELPMIADLSRDTTINVEVALDKIYYNKEIILDNIYYDYNQSDIRLDAQPTLDSLYDILTINPSVRIELSSHTDCRGESDYNMKLSQSRAESAVNYLIDKGIVADRLKSKGYGKSLLLDNCKCSDCTAEQHQKNRRTTFKVVRK